MAYKDLQSFIRRLEKDGEIVHVEERLDTVFEIPEAIKCIALQRGSAVYLENIRGYDTPIVANLLGSRKKMALAFGCPEKALHSTYLSRKEKSIKPVMVSRAPVQEVIHEKDINIRKIIPVLTHHERDAGPYFSSAITIAKDPELGVRGMGVHRVQVKDKNTLGIFLGSPPLSDFLFLADKMNRRLEVAVVLGADVLTFFTSVVRVPRGSDKLDMAGSFAQRPIELVKCRSIDLEVPARAQFVLEGYIQPRLREREGPFGESTGYYFTFDNPVAKIEVITHRKKPLYHALVPFTPEEDLLRFYRDDEMLMEINSIFPQVKKIYSRRRGQLVIAQIDKVSDEDGTKIIDNILSSNAYVKLVIIVDGDVDITNFNEVDWALCTRVRPERNIIVKTGLPGLSIDPTNIREKISEYPGFVNRMSKMGIDASKPLKELDRFERIDVPLKVKEKISALVKRL